MRLDESQSSPSAFYVLLTDEKGDMQVRITEELRTDDLVPLTSITPGRACITKFSEDVAEDNIWYRAEILSVRFLSTFAIAYIS